MLSFNLTFWVTGAMQCFDFKSIVPTYWWTQNITCQEKEILLKYLPDIFGKGEECLEMVCNFSFMGTWMSILFKKRHKQNLVSSVHFIVLYRTHVIQDVMRHELFYNVIVGCFIIQDIEHKEEEGDWFAVLTGVESFTEENKLGPLLQQQKNHWSGCTFTILKVLIFLHQAEHILRQKDFDLKYFNLSCMLNICFQWKFSICAFICKVAHEVQCTIWETQYS